ncbi:GLIPR1-like protein 1 [Pangasianodon hypophthalmus]|uniref:GLIPR1-like protein 1 n=1 Tax=Pangasianodon hypophthalmus TaxID=310915 RepID=UPI0023076FC6|nr:GLIPR1-like protein 1 [Pangasianodon hypophthalmus]
MADVLSLSLHLVLLLSSLSLSATGNPLPDITDPEFISSCVKEHNQARTSVTPSASNMRYMTWDDGLAVLARAWARNCLFKHNPQRTHPVLPSVGENIWAGAPPSTFGVKSAMQSWVNEVKVYDYNSLSCTKICGHYTQVVWATTYKVGCAVMACPNGVRETSFSHLPGAIFVCNYATAGNYAGTRPYARGAPCSACAGETCVNSLCHNATRDAAIRNNWTPDWDPALHVCGVFCKTVLIIRPISLLLIFGSVYVVQRRCPNIFAYIN